MLLLLIIPATGATRRQGIIDFVENRRVSDDGFANSVGTDIDLKSTVNALRIFSVLGEKVNNSLDILYYIQKLQNASGGFSSDSLSDPDLNSTITAIYGLQYLDINQSQYVNWKIFPFLNQTAQSQLLEVENGTIMILALTPQRLDLWNHFIITSTLLGQVPQIPVLELINGIKVLQYPNGSYPSFSIAISAINLLHTLNEIPNDPDLAIKFILTHQRNNGAFSSTESAKSSIKLTKMAVQTLSYLMDISQIPYSTEISRFVFNHQQARSGFYEVDTDTVTIQSTYDAIEILRVMGELDELFAPDVLQEVGFIDFPNFILPLGFLSILCVRRYVK